MARAKRALSVAVSAVVKQFLESLEARQLLTGDPIQGSELADKFVASRSPDQQSIVLTATLRVGTAQETTQTFTLNRDTTTALLVNGLGGDDVFELDASSGTPFHDDVLTFNGGDGTDRFEVKHHAAPASRVTYTPSMTDADGGSVITGFRSHAFDAVEAVDVQNVTALTLVTPNVNDRLLIDSSSATAGRVREAGTVTGNIVFAPLTFSATKTFVTDTAANDGTTPTEDQITVQGTGLTSIAPRASTSDPAVATDLRPYVGAGTNTLRLSAGNLSLAAGSTGDSGQTLDVIADAGTLSLTATQYLKSLTINANAQVVMPKVAVGSSTTPESPHKVLVLDALTIDTAASATARIDVADNALIVKNGHVPTLEAHLHRGLNEAAYPDVWSGAGITSSVAAASNLMTAVGLVRPSDSPAPEPADPDASGQVMADTDVLIKFTYFGDADLNGVIDGTDYNLVDNGFLNDLGGWLNGDFTYDGDSGDYFLIDPNFEASDANLLPTFTVSGSAATINEGSAFTLTASASTGENVPGIAAWSVYWGDGSHSVHAGNPATGLPTSPITHTYGDDGGPYTIQVFAKGQFNYFAGETTVTVEDVSPTLNVTGPASINEGGTYTLTFDATNIGDDEVSDWAVDWGDGSYGELDQPTGTLSHVYDGEESTRTIFIRAYDDDGSYDLEKTLAVNNLAPSASITGNASADEGASYTLNLSATDAGSDQIDHWVINWGDGDPETYYGNPSTLTHAYADNGSYTISVTAYDKDGAASAAATRAVAIANVAPTTSAIVDAVLGAGGQAIVYLSALDPGNDTLAWTINWGDGTTPQTVSAGTSYATHDYADPEDGPFSVTVTPSDEDAPAGGYSAIPYSLSHDPNKTYLYQVGLKHDGPISYGQGMLGSQGAVRMKAAYNTVTRAWESADQHVSDIPVRDKKAADAAMKVLETTNGGQPGTYIWNTVNGEFEATIPGSPTDTAIFTANIGADGGGSLDLNAIGSSGEPQKWSLSAVAQQVGITALDTGIEGADPSAPGYVAPGFFVTRLNRDMTALTVVLEKVHETTTDSDFSVPLIVTIPADEAQVFVPLTVLNDDTPEWTESFQLRIAQGQPFRIDPENPLARAQIVDKDIDAELLSLDTLDGLPAMTINNDDDDTFGVYDLDETKANAAEDDLFVLKLDFPEDTRPEATVTLTLDNPNVSVWDSQQKGRRLLGAAPGQQPIMLVELSPGQDTLYVEVTGGVLGDDTLFTLAGAEAATRPTTRPTTTQATTQGTTKPATQPVTDVQVVPITAFKWPSSSIRLAEFNSVWKLINHRQGETGQIVQHVIVTRDSWACNENVNNIQPRREQLEEYWEAWTVDGMGQIIAKSRTELVWGPANRDTFRIAHPWAAIQDRRGVTIEQGFYKYVPGEPVIVGHDVAAARDLFATRVKPQGWDDATAHNDHRLTANWKLCNGENDDSSAVTTPHIDVKSLRIGENPQRPWGE